MDDLDRKLMRELARREIAFHVREAARIAKEVERLQRRQREIEDHIKRLSEEQKP